MNLDKNFSIINFYETRADKISYRVLSCVIYKIIKIMSVMVIQLVNKIKSEILVGSGGGSKHGDKRFDKNIEYCNSRFINELNVLSWIFE